MSMFDSYDNIDTSVKPNNSSQLNNSYVGVVEDSIPRKVFDIKDRFIGYQWAFDDVFDFVVSCNKKIKVAKDAIIYEKSSIAPNTFTKGHKGQQAYNLVDSKSWTCVGLIGGMYIWVEDDNIIYPMNGTKEIEFVKDMTDKSLQVTFYNFRWESIKTFESSGESKIICNIDSDLYDVMKSGVYYATVRINEEESTTLEDKFMIIIT